MKYNKIAKSRKNREIYRWTGGRGQCFGASVLRWNGASVKQGGQSSPALSEIRPPGSRKGFNHGLHGFHGFVRVTGDRTQAEAGVVLSGESRFSGRSRMETMNPA
jgi:hypothetical protein